MIGRPARWEINPDDSWRWTRSPLSPQPPPAKTAGKYPAYLRRRLRRPRGRRTDGEFPDGSAHECPRRRLPPPAARHRAAAGDLRVAADGCRACDPPAPPIRRLPVEPAPLHERRRAPSVAARAARCGAVLAPPPMTTTRRIARRRARGGKSSSKKRRLHLHDGEDPPTRRSAREVTFIEGEPPLRGGGDGILDLACGTGRWHGGARRAPLSGRRIFDLARHARPRLRRGAGTASRRSTSCRATCAR